MAGSKRSVLFRARDQAVFAALNQQGQINFDVSVATSRNSTLCFPGRLFKLFCVASITRVNGNGSSSVPAVIPGPLDRHILMRVAVHGHLRTWRSKREGGISFDSFGAPVYLQPMIPRFRAGFGMGHHQNIFLLYRVQCLKCRQVQHEAGDMLPLLQLAALFGQRTAQ